MGCIFSYCNGNNTIGNDSLNENLIESVSDVDTAEIESSMFYEGNENKSKQEKINCYLHRKIELLEENTQENCKSLSEDIHLIYTELKAHTSNHQESSK